MKEKLSKLMTVKSIVTLILTGVFAYLSIIRVVSSAEFVTIFATIISFYFGTQYERRNTEGTK